MTDPQDRPPAGLHKTERDEYIHLAAVEYAHLAPDPSGWRAVAVLTCGHAVDLCKVRKEREEAQLVLDKLFGGN